MSFKYKGYVRAPPGMLITVGYNPRDPNTLIFTVETPVSELDGALKLMRIQNKLSKKNNSYRFSNVRYYVIDEDGEIRGGEDGN